METNNQSRTLYIIQVITLIVLILLLITQVLPFFGISVKPTPPLPNKGGGIYQSGKISGPTQGLLVIPPLVL
ncbi:MAG TPA: hypothetical protein VFB12_27120 [Ktedonobacteraceae bacterium]|nr:hypothetical protein [Ktedonobacteraceae bacterium]